MSKFFKALEQAQRDRQASRETPAPVATPPAPLPPIMETASDPALSARSDTDLPRAGSPEGVDEHLVSLLAPAGFEAEQYRSLRLLVEHKPGATPIKVIAVTSPAVGDGKSTTAINLAGALAQSPDARVLLIDADLRRPTVGRLLALGSRRGPALVDAIMDPSIGLDRIVEERPPFNLAVIRAGETPSNPYEILKSPRFGELLDEARKGFDYIIVDAPPLVPVQDCRIIARWVDAFLLVVLAHGTPRRLVEDALALIDPAKPISLVFNGDDHMSSGYNSRYYAGYYDPAASTNGHRLGRLRNVINKAGGRLRRPRRSQ
jgi:capsular exopolysaccharide synthesis family protein